MSLTVLFKFTEKCCQMWYKYYEGDLTSNEFNLFVASASKSIISVWCCSLVKRRDHEWWYEVQAVAWRYSILVETLIDCIGKYRQTLVLSMHRITSIPHISLETSKNSYSCWGSNPRSMRRMSRFKTPDQPNIPANKYFSV